MNLGLWDLSVRLDRTSASRFISTLGEDEPSHTVAFSLFNFLVLLQLKVITFLCFIILISFQYNSISVD